MKTAVKQLLHQSGMYGTASRRWIWLSPRLTAAIRLLTRRNGRIASRYLRQEAVPRLHIGCGDNALRGWLNTDLNPGRDQIYLDATRPFPFADGVFAYIYSEHMIEHVSWSAGRAMLAECHRVLKPGGVIRLVTPDLRRLMHLLTGPLSDLEEAYLDYSITAYGLPSDRHRAVHVVNNFMRAWGHQHIYDEASLREQLAAAGFRDVVPAELDASAHGPLNGLAKHDRMPAGLLALESLVLEATK